MEKKQEQNLVAFNQGTLITEKTCGQCGVIKPVSDFFIRKKNGKERPRAECKDCYRLNSRNRYSENKKNILERNKKYYESHRERLLVYRKEHGIKNKEKEKIRRKCNYLQNAEQKKLKRKEYYYANRESCIKSVERYVEENKEKVRERQRKHHHNKRANDLNYKMLKLLRGRMASAVKCQGVRKKSKTMELIGCSIQDLQKHLEHQFTEGMNWDNYGYRGWHIDHKIPCASFDLTKEEEQKKCFHWTNLQPLWALDNIKKSNKIIH